MDDLWSLPKAIELGGEECDIRTDFRAILDILKAMADPELSDQDKSRVMLEILYWNPEEIPVDLLEEAIEIHALVDLPGSLHGNPGWTIQPGIVYPPEEGKRKETGKMGNGVLPE